MCIRSALSFVLQVKLDLVILFHFQIYTLCFHLLQTRMNVVRIVLPPTDTSLNLASDVYTI